MEVTTVNENLKIQFDKNLEELKTAKKLFKEDKALALLSIAQGLSSTKEGMLYLFEKALELEEAGIFQGTVWDEPEKLVSSLAGGTLKADHPTSTYEILSELRMVRYLDQPEKSDLSREEVSDFLQQLVVHNLSLIFSPDDEESRQKLSKSDLKYMQNLFSLILEKIPFNSIKDKLAIEVEMICQQRPIMVKRTTEILTLVKNKIDLNPNQGPDRRLSQYINALDHPTKNTFRNKSAEDYQTFLMQADDDELEWECKQLGQSITKTGLVCKKHAQALLFVAPKSPKLIDEALDLNNIGSSELQTHLKLVQELIEKGISPATCQSIYGLSQLLNRGLLSRNPVKNGLQKLFTLEIHPDAKERILKMEGFEKGETDSSSLIVAGVISILGQPLGIGQGLNPTCQAARGISLWSQHAPGKLLNMVMNAAHNDNLEFYFEGALLSSKDLPLGLAQKLDYSLDVVSIILVPHLDKIYNEMMRRAFGRGEDPHKWVNPALYGQWIQTGFFSAYNELLHAVTNYEDFVRTFYASFHPDYNGGHDLIYPNPVGIFITSSSGKLLGFHAISLLRVGRSPEGEMRAYFLNPNNEGRQDWGQGIKPTVHNHGENHGESSLPFYQFVCRLYAYHYNRMSLGDKSHIDKDEIKKVIELSRESWGESYNWIEKKL